jgi:hypothetical protein
VGITCSIVLVVGFATTVVIELLLIEVMAMIHHQRLERRERVCILSVQLLVGVMSIL